METVVLARQNNNLLHTLKDVGIQGVTSWIQNNAPKVGAEEKKIPEIYIRPSQDERPNLGSVQFSQIPVMDFADLDDVKTRQLIVQQLDQAFRDWGFVQIVNHGIPQKLVDRIIEMEKQIFAKSEDELERIFTAGTNQSTHPSSGQFGTRFAPLIETVRDWRDVMKHHFFAGWESDTRKWPNNPSDHREVIVNYQKQSSIIGKKVLLLLAEALGIEAEFFLDMHDGSRSPSNVNFNYYPPCPEADLSLGITSHCDPGSINILLPDYDIPGLHILKDGKYVAVMPIPNALFVNVGDALQILTNDNYKSTPHRAIVNTERERISIVSFFGPTKQETHSRLNPHPKLITAERPRKYRDVDWGKHLADFATNQLKEGFHLLDTYRLQQQ